MITRWIHQRVARADVARQLTLIALVIALMPVAFGQQPSVSTSTWSGFQNGGVSKSAVDVLPMEWSPDENVVWQSAIKGYGQSTPVTDGRQIYVTSVDGSQRETYCLTAYGLADGRVRWSREFANPTPGPNTPMTSRAAPSAVVVTQGCVAFFEGGLIVAVGKSGETLWQKNLVELFGDVKARHGLAASLEQDDQHLYVWIEREEDPYLLSLDKITGDIRWRVPGLGSTSWASPRLVPVGDTNHLVCSAGGLVVGFDPDTGVRLWELDEIESNNSCTPTLVANGRFLIGSSDGRGEDTTGQGSQHNGVVQISQDESGFQAGFLWRAQKASSSFGSPIAAGGKAWFVNRAGVLYGLDLVTGEQTDQLRIEAGGIWATPLSSGQHLYLFGSRGTTSVLSLKDTKEVSANRLWPSSDGDRSTNGRVLYAAAVATPYLLLRRGDVLYAIKNQ